MQSTTRRSAYCYLCGAETLITRQQIVLNGKIEQHAICQECATMAQGHALHHALKNDRLIIERVCAYPGCAESASVECCMIGCMHHVCETHGNCLYEVSPDEVVPICWFCCGKGWKIEIDPTLPEGMIKVVNTDGTTTIVENIQADDNV